MLLYKTLQNAPEELKSMTKEGYMPCSELLLFMALNLVCWVLLSLFSGIEMPVATLPLLQHGLDMLLCMGDDDASLDLRPPRPPTIPVIRPGS